MKWLVIVTWVYAAQGDVITERLWHVNNGTRDDICKDIGNMLMDSVKRVPGFMQANKRCFLILSNEMSRRPDTRPTPDAAEE